MRWGSRSGYALKTTRIQVETLSLRQRKEICNGFIVELPIFIVKGTPVTAICCPCDEEFIEMIVVELQCVLNGEMKLIKRRHRVNLKRCLPLV